MYCGFDMKEKKKGCVMKRNDLGLEAQERDSFVAIDIWFGFSPIMSCNHVAFFLGELFLHCTRQRMLE